MEKGPLSWLGFWGLWLSWLQTEQHLREVGENGQEVAKGTRAGAGDGTVSTQHGEGNLRAQARGRAVTAFLLGRL